MPKKQVKFDFNGELITKREVICRIAALHPNLDPVSLRKRIESEHGIKIANSQLYVVMKSIRANGHKPKASLPQPAPAHEFVSGIDALKRAVGILGVAGCRKILDLFLEGK